MMTQTIQYPPGTLVRLRGREWIVLSGSDSEVLHLRPVTGSEEDQAVVHLALETKPIEPAQFPLPQPTQAASYDAALLLRDALLLSLRRGAGPFRSVGQIAVQPRAYQLVPLLMALRLNTIRLLVADDVGIGKTIEAGLIARELLDRGEIQRIAVLCPPHLVEQWQNELLHRFHLRAVSVTAASANRLERNLPPSESIFTTHPYTVVSLDYIKSEKRRSEFLRVCPDFVIVDEAHTCAATGQGRHQRYELLSGLAESPKRHLVLLTATPHSGDEEAFYRLLGLLNPAFRQLGTTLSEHERKTLREQLSYHFVQRRRPDIAEWKDGGIFPRRETTELTYKLTGAWDSFFHNVLDYCAEVVASAEGDERRQRLNFWGTLALMRCVASSPAAGLQALRTRAADNTEEQLVDRLFDGEADALSQDDLEPASNNDDPALARLIEQAEKLLQEVKDPKLQLLKRHLEELLRDGFQPVVFCRYIATARYLHSALHDTFRGVTVGVVTGEISSEERKEKVEALGEADRRVLIATDCLSEGVNLQEHFNAVIHYDLSWNPTRHEQREGRVDRFGQESKVVRSTLLYGSNNPVDGAVLEVILRKAQKIREELGVPVPIPDEGHSLTTALLRAVLLRNRSKGQLDLGGILEAQSIDTRWKDAADKAKRNMTIFSQKTRILPEEVFPEWQNTRNAIGGKEEVFRFTRNALARLGASLEPRRSKGYKVPTSALPQDVRERLEAEGLSGVLQIDFDYPAAAGCKTIQRSHPLVSVLAETLLSRTLSAQEPSTDPVVLGRVGCWVSSRVQTQTTIALLRLRHQLIPSDGSAPLLVEEATALGWSRGSTKLLSTEDALALLLEEPSADLPAPVRERIYAQACQQLGDNTAMLESFAEQRAQALLKDHTRVRNAVRYNKLLLTYRVQTLLPADVIAVYLLQPKL